MRVEATGPGRKGTMAEGVGTLRLSGAKDMEAKQVLALYQEIRDGNFGFWTALMWAARSEKLTTKERLAMDRIIDRIKDEAFS